MLTVRDLRVVSEGKEILHGVSLDVRAGEIVALMGPNGSGKSTLAFALMGHPRYQVTSGTATYASNPQLKTEVKPRFSDILGLKPEERARKGIFLSFQYPHEIPGVPFGQMLRTAVGQKTGTLPPVRDFLHTLDGKLALLKMDPSFAERNVNEGFSGGEKKRAEILQLAVLEPSLAILDETDSGLDVDALRTVAEGIKAIRSDSVFAREPGRPKQSPGRGDEIASSSARKDAPGNAEITSSATPPRNDKPTMSVLLITHYERFLEFLTPDRVLVMKDGRIVAEGGKDLADRIQREGYETFG